MVSAGQDGTVRVWAPKTGMSKHVFRLVEGGGGGGEYGGGEEEEDGPGTGLTCLAVGGGSDGQLAIAGGENGTAYVVHISGKKLVATLPHYDESPGGVAAQAPTGDTMEEDDQVVEARSVEAVGFCPSTTPGTAHWCATGGVDGILKIWIMGSGGAQLRNRCQREDSEKGGITRLRWHESLPLVIASYTDGKVCIWDVRMGKMVDCLTGHEDMINDMDVSFVSGSTSAIVVTGSDDKSVRMFELHSTV